MQPPSPMRVFSRGIPENRARSVSAKYKYRINSNWPNGKTPIKLLKWNIKLALSPRFPVCCAVQLPSAGEAAFPSWWAAVCRKAAGGGRGPRPAKCYLITNKSNVASFCLSPSPILRGPEVTSLNTSSLPKVISQAFWCSFYFSLTHKGFFFSFSFSQVRAYPLQ